MRKYGLYNLLLQQTISKHLLKYGLVSRIIDRMQTNISQGHCNSLCNRTLWLPINNHLLRKSDCFCKLIRIQLKYFDNWVNHLLFAIPKTIYCIFLLIWIFGLLRLLQIEFVYALNVFYFFKNEVWIF